MSIRCVVEDLLARVALAYSSFTGDLDLLELRGVGRGTGVGFTYPAGAGLVVVEDHFHRVGADVVTVAN